jgi:hypothetical protein
VESRTSSIRSQLEQLRLVNGVIETDLELILLDLIHKSSDFLDLLVTRGLDGQNCRELIGAWRSLDEDGLVSHLTALVKTGSGRDAALLIEGRVSAATPSHHAARRRERGVAGSGDGSWDRFATCLVAPSGYLDSEPVSGWDCLVAIEDIRPYAEAAAPGVAVAVLDSAVAQYRDRKNMPQDPAVVAFSDAYARLCEREYPDLRVHRPSLGRTEDIENWVQFADGFLQRAPTDVRLCHRPGLGQVDIEIAKARPAEVRLFLERVIPAGATIERLGEGTVIRFRVAVIDQRSPFAEQEAIVHAALGRARELLSFWVQQRTRLSYGDVPL